MQLVCIRYPVRDTAHMHEEPIEMQLECMRNPGRVTAHIHEVRDLCDNKTFSF